MTNKFNNDTIKKITHGMKKATEKYELPIKKKENKK